jgi:hypothetical protein
VTEWGIDNLFNPGKRHMDEEKRRLQSTREDIGDSSGGRRIDLDSGAVTIVRRRPADGGPPVGAVAEDAEAENEPSADTTDDAAAVPAEDEKDRSAG